MLHTVTASVSNNMALTSCIVCLQLFTLSIFIFVLACVGVFYPYNRGALFTALIVLYALTASVSGYMAASYYTQMEGTQWVRNILLTCVTFCGPLFLMFCFNNTVAIVYRVSVSDTFILFVIPEMIVDCCTPCNSLQPQTVLNLLYVPSWAF